METRLLKLFKWVAPSCNVPIGELLEHWEPDLEDAACDVRDTVGQGTVLQYLYDVGDLEKESDLLAMHERRYWLWNYLKLMKLKGPETIGAVRTKGNRWWVILHEAQTPHVYSYPWITVLPKQHTEGVVYVLPMEAWLLMLQGLTHEAGGVFDAG